MAHEAYEKSPARTQRKSVPGRKPVLPLLQETTAQRLQAWQHGLLSDNDAEWGRQLAALASYTQQHGDAHVGHRPGDDPELMRWTAKQRAASKGDDLPADRCAVLQLRN